jgi:hypothetical protein
LRHYATIQKVAVSIPDEVFGFLIDVILPATLMALRSTQPLTEMSTRNLPGDEGQLAHEADNLTAVCEPTVYKMWEPQHLTTQWASTACYRDTFTFLFDTI